MKRTLAALALILGTTLVSAPSQAAPLKHSPHCKVLSVTAVNLGPHQVQIITVKRCRGKTVVVVTYSE